MPYQGTLRPCFFLLFFPTLSCCASSGPSVHDNAITKVNFSNEYLLCFDKKNRQSSDDSNPVLMNKRYPYVSTKQLNRWSTESGDQYRWRKKSGGLGSP